MLELIRDQVDTPPLPAATVVLLRPMPAGVQVYMVRRHGDSSVLAGAYVFPGGKVDREDSQPESVARFAVRRDFARLLGEPDLSHDAACGVVYAACRETFEECGVLLVAGADRNMQQRAQALAANGQSFGAMLGELGVALDAEAIHAWSRWITPTSPSVMRKRFDTRFLMVQQPEAQLAQFDARESTAGEWMAPRDWLDRYWQRDIDLAPPQIMTLAHLTRFDSVQAVLMHSRRSPPPVIQPNPLDEGEVRWVTYPGDPHHWLGERAMPGPLRLAFRQGRFEPQGGYEDFFR